MTRVISALVIVMGIWVWCGPVAAAPSEDVAYFQEALAPYGQWLPHPRYGQVWRPHRVDRSWRPYTDGRWVLTQDGYVFETEEPWGWATYHYGNWLHTPEHGWVWVPGRTWYPHTCTWRANEEHVGWAPVPPAEASPSDLGWSGDYGAGGDYGYSGSALPNLPASWWNFTRATDFLSGWGEPYGAQYSYLNSGLLASSLMAPTIYTRTVYIYNYVTPAYAPRGCFNWGPPAVYIMKVKRLPQHDFARHCQRHRLQHLRNVLPPPQVVARQPVWRHLVPAAATEGRGSGRWWSPASTRAVALNRPDALPAPPVQSTPHPVATAGTLVPKAEPRPQATSAARADDAKPGRPSPGRLELPPRLTAAGPGPDSRARGNQLAPRPGQETSATATPDTVTAASRRHLPPTPPARGLSSTPAAPDVAAGSRQTSAPPFPRAAAVPTPRREGPPPLPPGPGETNSWRHEAPRRPPEPPRVRPEQEARQAMSQRQQQQRQAEMLRQQQEHQARQAEAFRQRQAQQQRQAEILRQRQERPHVEQRQPPPARSHGPGPAAPEKKKKHES